MGNTRPEREEPLARIAYIAAARRFVGAFAAFVARGVPIDPGSSGRDVRDWSAADVAVLRELHAAMGEVLKTRRVYDGLRRRR